MRRTLPLILMLAGVSCGDDSSPTSPSSSGPAGPLLRHERDERHRQPGRTRRRRRQVPESGDGRRPRRTHVAGLPERRTRPANGNQPDAREGSHRHRSVVQREPGARREQP